jgi:hypothetical protein
VAITNGDFETGNLNGWTTNMGTPVVVNTEKHGGNYSCKADASSGYVQFQTHFAANPGYNLGIWYKVPTITNGDLINGPYLRISMVNGTTTNYDISTQVTEWTYHEFDTSEMGDGDWYIQITGYYKSGESLIAYIDDLTFIETGLTPTPKTLTGVYSILEHVTKTLTGKYDIEAGSSGDIFIDGEELTGDVAGVVINTGTGTLLCPKVSGRSISVYKSIEDAFWVATIDLVGYYSNTAVADYQDVEIVIPDHNGTDRTVFYGFVPEHSPVENLANNITRITAYSHDWYLSHQYVPEEYQSTLIWDPVEEHATFYEPSVVVTALLGGGANWNTTTGCRNASVIAVSDWGEDISSRGFVWPMSTTKWKAIMDMAEYCNYVFDVAYDGTDPCARFCDVADIDTYMIPPSAVTITNPDDYLVSLKAERKGSEQCNRVVVRGNLYQRILKFDAGDTEFQPEEVLTDGTTGHTATISTGADSVVVESGTWAGNDAAGYLILDADRTGSFTDDGTITSTSGSATANGTDERYAIVDSYTKTLETSEVTAGTDRPIEYVEDATEDYDSEALIDDRAQALYDYLTTAQILYTAVFKKRTDLKLWQKIKFMGYSAAPESYLRITSVRYDQRLADVTVTITAVLEAAFQTQRKLKTQGVPNQVSEIERIIENKIAATPKPMTGEAVGVNGGTITVTIDGIEYQIQAKDASI